jgi:TatD DNase family protein
MIVSQLIDTHCHLYSEEFLDDRHQMITRAVEEGISRFYLPNIDVSSMDAMIELEKEYPGRCFAMMGLHLAM